MKKKIFAALMTMAMSATMLVAPVSADATYLIYDDFNSGTFESSGWTHYKSEAGNALTADVSDGTLKLTGTPETGEKPGVYKTLNGTDGITCAPGELLEVKFRYTENSGNKNADSIDLKLNTKDITTSTTYSQLLATLQTYRIQVQYAHNTWSTISYVDQASPKVDVVAYFDLSAGTGDWYVTEEGQQEKTLLDKNMAYMTKESYSTIYDIGFFARDRGNTTATVDYTIDYVSVRKVKKAEVGLADYNYIDISSQLNKDMLAKAGQTVTETWNSDYYATDAERWTNKGTGNEYIEGMQCIKKGSYVDGSYTFSDEKICFSVPEARLEAGTKDAIEFDANGDSTTIESGNYLVDNLYILWDVTQNAGPSAKITITYADGDTDVIDDLHLACPYMEDSSTNNTWYNPTSASGHYKYVVGCVTSSVCALGYNRNNIAETANDSGYTVADQDGKQAGFVMYGIPVDGSRKVTSYTIESTSDAESAIYAITEELVTIDKMQTAIEAVKNITAVTKENAADIITAKAYVEELVNRNVAVAADYEFIDELCEKAKLWDNAEEGKLSFTPTVSRAGNTVTAKVDIVNATDRDANYVLIVAAYDTDGKLLGVKTSSAMVIAAGASDICSRVMDTPGAATQCKAMVWNSIGDMTPLCGTGN